MVPRTRMIMGVTTQTMGVATLPLIMLASSPTLPLLCRLSVVPYPCPPRSSEGKVHLAGGKADTMGQDSQVEMQQD
jgi:hypothetical protein